MLGSKESTRMQMRRNLCNSNKIAIVQVNTVSYKKKTWASTKEKTEVI